MNVVLAVVAVAVLTAFLPYFVNGFPSVHHHHHCYNHHPFDSFKVRRLWNSNGVERFAFSFSSRISAPPPPGDQDETKNKTLPDKDNLSSDATIDGNFTAFANSSSANKTKPVFQQHTQSSIDDSKNNKSSRGSGLRSYFPFPFQSQSKIKGDTSVDADVNKAVDETKKSNNTTNNNNNSSALATALLNKSANEPITVADLEVLLEKIQSVSHSGTKSDAKKSAFTKPSSTNGIASTKVGNFQATTSTKTASVSSSSASSSSQVAFPQLSEVSETDVRRSTAITGCFLGMIIGITVLPNLWLVGMISGVLYGYEITKDISEYDPSEKSSVANLLITCATQLAKAYQKTLDGMKALWFLYKTGQLSYEYYKSYETLDKRFAIQNKVDAWNKVFVKGKQRFDVWEKENEVGRKVLAGLRTAWLVDEESRMRAAGRSQYRLVQSAYDLKRSVTRLLQRTIESIRSLFEEGGLQTFWKGLQADLRREGSLSVRLGAIGAALVAVNVCGALFSISAGFSNLLAVIGAVIWPTWAGDLLSRTQEIWLDIQSRGGSSNKKGKKYNNNDIFEWIQQCYEEHSRDKMSQSRNSQRSYRNRTWSKQKPKRKQVVASKRKKRNRNTNRQTKTTPSWFGFGNRQTRRDGDVGTWGNFRKTR